MSESVHHALAHEKASGKVEVIARRPHRHGERTAGHPDFQRFFRGEGVRTGICHSVGHAHDSISTGYDVPRRLPIVVLRWTSDPGHVKLIAYCMQ